MPRRGGKRRAGTSVLLALAAGLLALPAVAVAEHRGGRSIGSLLPCDEPVNPPRCTSVGNDIWHFIVIDESVPPALAAAVRRAARQDYDPTYLRVRVQRRITSATDVIVYAADHGENGAAGWVYCPPDAPRGHTAQGDRWCQQQELHFNLNPRYGAFFADRASRDSIACHELGHTVGLLHWGNPPSTNGPAVPTCMTPDNPNGPTDLHAIDREHISLYYAVPDIRPRIARPFERDQDTGTGDFSALVRSGPLSHW
ncbi:MAG TPA: hypothetical protein VFY43_05150 [Candidatus Limnocylindria bacterium]|nr:hypothetical protein [Candidatus Limnocylindria bacterium]